ncbi:MAG: hypothetical protein AAB897_03620 [Patescibacteria group bacterium]
MSILKINKKYWLAFILLAVVFMVATPLNLARAQELPSARSCAGNLVGCGVYVTALLANKISGLLVSGGAYLFEISLEFSAGAARMPVVENGFSTALAIANLGFVLGIIVIAIATILRNQTYGIKQLLWKLVVAAILVNFSLVIGRTIVESADNLTKSFLPNRSVLAARLADALKPQAANIPPVLASAGSSGAWSASVCADQASKLGTDALRKAAAATCSFMATILDPVSTIQNFTWFWGLGLGDLFRAALNMVMVVFVNMVIAFTLLAAAIMLIIRFFYIGILLILMPFAWLMWIFPNFKYLWTKWWGLFLRWTMFAPVVVIFLFLASETAQIEFIDNIIGGAGNLNSSAAIALSAGTGNPALTFSVASQIMVAAFALGGLFAANSLGIHGASFAMGIAKSAGTMAAGYVGKQTKKGGRAILRSTGIAERMRTSPLRPVAIAGRALAGISTNEAMVAEAAKKVLDRKEDVMAGLRGSMNTETRMAYLQKAQKEGWIKPDTEVGGMSVGEFLNRNREKFKGYGQSGEGSLEEKLREDTKLAEQDWTNEEKTINARNGELNKKRSLSDEDAAKQAGLGDDDRNFYLAAEKESEYEFALRSEKDKERFSQLRSKAQEAREKGGLSPEEQREFEENQRKLGDIERKRSKYVSKNPDAAAATFQDHEAARAKLAAEGKPIPATLEKESIERMQEAMLSAMAKGFSPHTARALLDAIGKANNLKHFEAAVMRLKEGKTPEDKKKFDQIQMALNANTELKRWMQNSAGRALFGNIHELFGLKKLKNKKRKIEDEEDEEEA